MATAHPLSPRQCPRNQRGKTKEGSSTPQKDKQGQGWLGETCASTLTKRTGLLALWPLSSGTGLCLLFTDTEPLVVLLVTTLGVQSLERPGKPNSSRDAMSPVTEACSRLATFTPAPACRLERILCLVLLLVRCCPSTLAEDVTRLSPYIRGKLRLKSAVCRQLENDPVKMPILRSCFHRVP